ncbi:MAG: hypothetical protein CML18_05060 [Pusillimonas sp.]|nr:hypothetical protein [Pusillimonas sp.]|tara:strand:+ start:137630 stop:138067 length:438 start_codon:yes stop_codon:yes gene_type:complete
MGVWFQLGAPASINERARAINTRGRIPQPTQNIQSFRDFEGKRIVVLAQSIQQSYLESALAGFGVNAKIIPVDRYEEGFKLVEQGQADAVVSNHHFGNYTANTFNVEETPIIFLPSGLYFATAESLNPDLLATVDQQLQAWYCLD